MENTQSLTKPHDPFSLRKIDAYLEKYYKTLWMALRHHKTHKNQHLTMAGHQYMKAILMDKTKHIVVMKSTQCGISECLIVLVIGETINGRSVFYVLPTYDIMGRFVSNRFEKSLAYTPYYKQFTKGGVTKKSDNKTLKDIGKGVISFAGSNTPVPFTEFPADTYVIDEKDQCHQDHIKMGKERLGHADDPRMIEVSNPTITDFAIDEAYAMSDKKLWSMRCSRCNEFIFPSFFDHVVREVEDQVYILRDKTFDKETGQSLLAICDKCERPFDRYSDGEWVYQQRSAISGYQISKIFSGKIPLSDLVFNFNRGLVNDFEMQRFYNSDLGLPFVQAGAKLTTNLLNSCIRNYNAPMFSDKKCVMGVDVGAVLHVRINEILEGDQRRAVFIGTVNELEDLFLLVKQYNVVCAVIDALPETRLAKTFAHSFKGGFRCFFGTAKRDILTPKEKTVTVDRTQLLDTVKEEFILEKIYLPGNASSIDSYYDQMTASTRIYDEAKEMYRWEEGSKADHYFLTEGYCSLAFKLLKLITK